MIDELKGQYRFLSNFYLFPIQFEGWTFGSVEAAYQSQKSTDCTKWALFCRLSPGDAKREGRKLTLRDGWDELKYAFMLVLLRRKFSTPPLSVMLRATGTEELIEGNWWHDNEWGDCRCGACVRVGQNRLGKLLMHVREELGDGD